MNRFVLGCAAAGACLAPSMAALAHGIAGARVFVATLTIDDPAVSDEASFPTITYLRHGADGGPGPTYETDITGEFDKTITRNFGFAINDGYTVLDTAHDKTRIGWQDLTVTAKYQVYVNAEHEFMMSLGVIREFGHTGTTHIGADQYGSTTPTVYFGKGLGDLPIGWLRPLAITGTGGFAIADRELKVTGQTVDPDTGLTSMLFNNGYANRWVGGLSLQYSIPYLQSQVRHLNIPDFVARLTPLVELAYSSPATSPSDLGTQLVFAPGVIYSGDTYQLGIEALIPGNKASGSNVGVITQFHVFLDDLFPNSIGRPIFR
ncbi:MAG: hypothetical protein JO264_09640 [Acidisphaera sp.]|nr:hypothetical protein [Acidisphaera sp.]